MCYDGKNQTSPYSLEAKARLQRSQLFHDNSAAAQARRGSATIFFSFSHDFLTPGLQGDLCSKFSARLLIEGDQQQLLFLGGAAQQ